MTNASTNSPPATLGGEPTTKADLRIRLSHTGRGRMRMRLGGSPSPDRIRDFFARAETLADLPDVMELAFRPDRAHVDLTYHWRSSSVTDIADRVKTHLLAQESASPETSTSSTAAGVGTEAALVDRWLVPGARPFRLRSLLGTVTSWEVLHRVPGRVRLRHPMLKRNGEVTRHLEHELMATLGVERYEIDRLAGTVLIMHDEGRLPARRLVIVLESLIDHVLHESAEPTGMGRALDRPDLDLPINTAVVGLATVAQFAFPALRPLAIVVILATYVPTFKGVYETLFKERRIGVDVLDALFAFASVAVGALAAAAINAWCLSLSRVLVERGQADSSRALFTTFGKQARFAWLLQGGQEVEVPLTSLKPGDRIVVNTGEAVPVDGTVERGTVMVDQHVLTGESAPVARECGNRVLALTTVVAGKAVVRVEQAGEDTTSAQIMKVLKDSAGYTLATQARGEKLADRVVVPTLGVSAAALAFRGAGGAVAILNSDIGTGIRVAAPLALLSSLRLCAENGILVKDGRALERLVEVDTVLFDKTGTLTFDRLEVTEVFPYGPWTADRVAAYAAAAERRFTHPIALAIRAHCGGESADMPAGEDTAYRVGYGVSVGIDGRRVLVGSERFLTMESVTIPGAVSARAEAAAADGASVVHVAIDGGHAGLIILHSAIRPEAAGIVAQLRARGIKHLAIVSGDRPEPTRRLANQLGLDEAYSQVLPQEKAAIVERLQAEGRTVCFIGDGINDSIALKQADVSVSLQGASSIAMDAAQVVFMDNSLERLTELVDIARALERNVKRSWGLILVPNLLCFAGVFTMGFGVAASVITNNAANVGALINGLSPLRRVKRQADARDAALHDRGSASQPVREHPADR